MKQQVEVTLKLSLWLDTAMDEDAIVTHVRSALPDAFGEALTAMQNPVNILDVKQEAEIFGSEESAPFDIDDYLTDRRQIADIWGTEDVLEVRPDLTPEQAWEVLKLVKRTYDANHGITWEHLSAAADGLFPEGGTA